MTIIFQLVQINYFTDFKYLIFTNLKVEPVYFSIQSLANESIIHQLASIFSKIYVLKVLGIC